MARIPTSVRVFAVVSAAVVFTVLLATASVLAHPMLVRGTVAAVEARRVQVKTGAEKSGEKPAWFAVDAKTKIYRDKTVVSFEDAKIQTGERIVVNVDHDADGTMHTTEIRLAAR